MWGLEVSEDIIHISRPPPVSCESSVCPVRHEVMAGVVASNVRNVRNKSISLKEHKEDQVNIRRLQQRQV